MLKLNNREFALSSSYSCLYEKEKFLVLLMLQNIWQNRYTLPTDYVNSNWPWESDAAAAAAGEEDAPSEFARLNACINFLSMSVCVPFAGYYLH